MSKLLRRCGSHSVCGHEPYLVLVCYWWYWSKDSSVLLNILRLYDVFVETTPDFVGMWIKHYLDSYNSHGLISCLQHCHWWQFSAASGLQWAVLIYISGLFKIWAILVFFCNSGTSFHLASEGVDWLSLFDLFYERYFDQAERLNII
jgi:hypothetical protein